MIVTVAIEGPHMAPHSPLPRSLAASKTAGGGEGVR